ncbi:DUF2721 domain-containing protein [Alteromonas halophila]|uniref:DUF2721 domain-containing protein n=1 Tax=Alteromonas halophila TaxID=516698 RepID=A0A918MWJ7_9ALTE|nr:DUF2721 domain-containing protein [Alteromonas halophila]GGW77990.1 hypothetical protein GCM10007391_08180 [Alteromonas halophila]
MDTLIPSLSQLIEFAVAPVFLLAGIAGFLNVMSVRLGRITDRVRESEECIQTYTDPQLIDRTKREILVLWRRVKVINRAIALCVAAGLMVCTVIMALFAGSLWAIDLKVPVIVLFILAMCFLISALLMFLVEIKLATQAIRIVRTIR